MSGVTDPVLPLTVHVGFAGPRRLSPDPLATPAAEAALLGLLREQLAALPAQLGLSTNHFVTAVSQVAAGADLLFTEAAASLGWLHRVVLPQPAQDYLAAGGANGPDFTDSERQRAVSLLAQERVVEVVVASTADSRTQRFEDANLRILSEADVVVVLRIEGAPERPGGTADLLRGARERKLRRLVLTMSADASGMPQLQADWDGSDAQPFSPPGWPACVQDAAEPLQWQRSSLPDAAECAQRIKQAASARAGERQRLFRRAAWIIVGTHIVATALALWMLKAPPEIPVMLVVLGLELALLWWGLSTHRNLHHERATLDWAIARLCAEVARSVQAIQGVALTMAPMQVQMFPAELQPMVRTLQVLHLRDFRSRSADWTVVRDRYLAHRLEGGLGQVRYYETAAQGSHRWAVVAAWCFAGFSALAMGATFYKWLFIGATSQFFWEAGAVMTKLAGLAGPIAILAPVVAVGVMSLASALDVEARAHTFKDTWRFVHGEAARIRLAGSEREFSSLVMSTEARLLGETLGWVARRAYLGIS